MPDSYVVIAPATATEWPEQRTFTGLRLMPGTPTGLHLGTSEGPHLWFEGWSEEDLDGFRDVVAGGGAALVIGGGDFLLG